jgi:hypothetical protein
MMDLGRPSLERGWSAAELAAENNRLEAENADLRRRLAAAEAGNAPSPRNPAVEIIRSLDASLKEFYGAAGERLCPAGNDLTTAMRWIEAGASVERVTDVLRGVVERQKGRGKPAPHSLAYFQRAVIDALARPAETIPSLAEAASAAPKTPAAIVAVLRKHPALTDSE